MCSPSKLCQLRIYDNDYILSKNKFAKKIDSMSGIYHQSPHCYYNKGWELHLSNLLK